MMQRHAFVLLVCLASGIAVGCSNAETKKKKYFAQAEQALANKQYSEAILGYRNAIKIDPRYGEARYKLAEAYAGAGDLPNSAREYVRAAELLPDNLEANLKAAQFLMVGQQFDQARARAQRVVDIDPKNVQGRILLGSAIAGLKDYAGALKEIEEAIRLAPASGAGYTNRAALMLAQGKKDEAQQNFEKAVEIEPKAVGPRLALASYFWSVGSLPDAEKAIRGALDVDPASGVANRALAILLMGTGRAKQAEPYVKASVKAAGTPEAELALADYYIDLGDTTNAKPILERLLAGEKTANAAGIKLGQMEYATGDHASAYKRIDTVLAKAPSNVDALNVKARWLLAERRAKEALVPAELAVKTDPKSAEAHFLLGTAKGTLGQTNEAKAEFGEVLKINPRAGAAQTALAGLSLAAGSTDAGVQFAQEALASQPANVNARLLLVRGLLMRNETDRAASELAALSKSMPNDPQVAALNGGLLLLKKDKVGARREYERAIKLDPHSVDALAGMTSLDISEGQLAKARARLDAELAGPQPNSAVLLLAARTDLVAADLTAAETKLRQVVERSPSSLEAYSLLGGIYIKQNKLDAARHEFETLAGRQEKPIGAHTIIGMLLQLQKQDDEALKAYQRALDLDPSSPVAANNVAYMLADRNQNLDQALQLAKAAASRLPDEPSVADTVGWVYYKKQLPMLAIPQFEKSVQRAPANPLFQYHLGLAYAGVGETQKARKALEESLRLNPSFDGAAEARQALASLKG